MNKTLGTLIRWNDIKGFGFIKPDTETVNRESEAHSASGNVFIHISKLSHMSRRPQVGDKLSFEIETKADGKTNAINADIEGVARACPKSVNENSVPDKSLAPSGLHHKQPNPIKGVFWRMVFMLCVLAVASAAYNRVGAAKPSPEINPSPAAVVPN